MPVSASAGWAESVAAAGMGVTDRSERVTLYIDKTPIPHTVPARASQGIAGRRHECRFRNWNPGTGIPHVGQRNVIIAQIIAAQLAAQKTVISRIALAGDRRPVSSCPIGAASVPLK